MPTCIDYADSVFENSDRVVEFLIQLTSFDGLPQEIYENLTGFYEPSSISGHIFTWVDIQPNTEIERKFCELFEDEFGKSKEPEKYRTLYFTVSSWTLNQKLIWLSRNDDDLFSEF
jgi:hypothetical protein